MPISILMPALSPTMEAGKLAKWHVKEGDAVSSGDVIAEIETDKATMEVEAVDEGVIGKLVVKEGTDGVAVNATIALLLEEGESADALDDVDTGASAMSGPQPDELEQPESGRSGDGNDKTVALESSRDTGPDSVGSSGQSKILSAEKPVGSAEHNRLFASPLARRLAAASNIDLNLLRGSGPNGRIIKRDIEQAMASGAALEAGKVQPAGLKATELVASDSYAARVPGLPGGMSDEEIKALYDSGSYELVPHDNMRRIIAARLVESKLTIPHFYLTLDCELDNLLASRTRMNATAPQEGRNAFRLSVNDFIIKALAMALQQVPHANATWTRDAVLRHKSSDIGVAVAVEGGLFTPVIRHAELKSLSEISNEMKELGERARNKRLAPHEYQGGTTSISNLGMYGISKFDAVINPPHASILAVGRGEKRPVVKGEELQIATVMTVTLSCDHRVIDGALGAELLGAFKQFIEDPVTMLV